MAQASAIAMLPSGAAAELAAPIRRLRAALLAAFAFSAIVNLLMLAAPLYMLQVYDRVLVSRSVETLAALTFLLAGLFLIMGVTDHVRGRVMARVGATLEAGLQGRVMAASLRRLALGHDDRLAFTAVRDLQSLSRFWGSPAVLALFDLPWTPVFFAALFIFHPWLFLLALAGTVVLAIASWANQHSVDPALHRATEVRLATERTGTELKHEAEVIHALGMEEAALRRWSVEMEAARLSALAASDASGRWSVAIRTFRLFLQSAMLGLAALLVLRQELSAGAMVAASILTGRALQPIEQTVAFWPALSQARQARARLRQLLELVPRPQSKLDLPRPAARLMVQGLTVIPPEVGTPSLRNVSFVLNPGEVMGVIGPSASGKSSLAKALAGIWRPHAGQVRLDGAALGQYDADRLGRWIGYLPQRITLFEGTIAENIARLQSGADPHDIIAAARAAGAHDMIQRLTEGYDTRVVAGGGRLSGGQIQRIGLARALYGDPVLVILDEPNANLDSEGSEALNLALRAARSIGSAVLIMAHRPAALQECDQLLVLKEGRVVACGPRDQVLRETVRNAGEVSGALKRGAGG